MGLDQYLYKRTNELIEVAYWRKANAIHGWFVRNVQSNLDDCEEYPVEPFQLAALLADVNRVLDASTLVPSTVKRGERSVAGGRFEPILASGHIIADPTVAIEVLPTTAGFFFGSTDYDDHYIDNLIYTRNTLTLLLTRDPNQSYFYQSSW